MAHGTTGSMKHTLVALAFGLILLACSDPPGSSPDGGVNPPTEDASNPVPDANPNSDINPPLTPDDPCRQLKLEFEVEVLSADAAYLGDLLVVAYQTQTETAVATYRNEELENVWPLPAGQPKLFYSRDELHVTVGSEGDFDNRVWEILPDVAPRVVVGEEIQTSSIWHVSGGRTDADDLLLAHWSNASAGSFTYINGEQSYPGVEVAGAVGGTGDWWPIRTSANKVSAAEAYATRLYTGMEPELVTMKVDHSITGGPASGVVQASVPYMRAFDVTLMSAALESVDNLIVALDFREGEDSIEYVSIEPGGTTMVVLREVARAHLATYGAGIGDYASGQVRTLFVEFAYDADGLAGSWSLVDPSGSVLAVGRDGLAGSQGNPGSLVVVGDTVMWAGPTIRDGKTSNYPADAIAVCQLAVQP